MVWWHTTACNSGNATGWLACGETENKPGVNQAVGLRGSIGLLFQVAPALVGWKCTVAVVVPVPQLHHLPQEAVVCLAGGPALVQVVFGYFLYAYGRGSAYTVHCFVLS